MLALGCSSNTAATTVIVRPQLVAVEPDDFLSALPRGDVDLVQSYVATLFDVTPAADGGSPSPFQLASSPPTPPLLPVSFSFVITSHAYLAQVDAYDRAPQTGADDPAARQIAPSTPGGRLQFNKDGARVAPRWVFTCGGYPPSSDGGSSGGAAAVGEEFPGGAAGDDGTFPPGIVAFDGVTQTAHDCRVGLPPVTN